MRTTAAGVAMGWLGRAGDPPAVRMLQVAATLGPVGYAPVAPGTVASLVAAGVWLALAPIPLRALGLLVPLGALAVAAAEAVSRQRGVADPSEVVIDEAVGMLLALGLAPAGIAAAASTFVAFRALDIVKPFPVGRLERLRGGWGILADDLAAALYAAGAVRLAWYLLG